MCGVCNRSTLIPSMNIVNSINKGLRDAHKETYRIYYDISKHPYITCPRCNTNVPVDMNKTKTDQKDQKEQKEGDSQPGFSALTCYSCGQSFDYSSTPNITNAQPVENLSQEHPLVPSSTIPSDATTPITASKTPLLTTNSSASETTTVSGTKTT